MAQHQSFSELANGGDAAMSFQDDGLADLWADPADLRVQLRRRLIRYQAGFLVLGLALIFASVMSVGRLLAQQLRLFPLLQWLHQWEFGEGGLVVLGSLTGVALLWGRWPDRNWQRRSGLLLLLCLVDLVSWTMDHATRLGFSEVEFGHEYFRDSLGAAISWSEFALIASLAAEMAGSLGDRRAFELGKAARSLTTLTGSVWLFYFALRTDWNAPVWPLRPFPVNMVIVNLHRCWTLLYTILLIQVTMLCLNAARSCGQSIRQMAAEDRANETVHLPSEHSWNELQGRSPADFNPWEPPRESKP